LACDSRFQPFDHCVLSYSVIDRACPPVEVYQFQYIHVGGHILWFGQVIGVDPIIDSRIEVVVTEQIIDLIGDMMIATNARAVEYLA
jgi:hypothetical protein